LFEPASSAWHRNDERGFRKSTSSCNLFSTIERQGANGRFQVRGRDGAITEIGAHLPMIVLPSSLPKLRSNGPSKTDFLDRAEVDLGSLLPQALASLPLAL